MFSKNVKTEVQNCNALKRSRKNLVHLFLAKGNLNIRSTVTVASMGLHHLESGNIGTG